MNIEICFLNKKGALSCLMNESFFSIEQAERYARSLLRGPMGASIARVELSQVRREAQLVNGNSVCDMAFSLKAAEPQ